MNVTYACPHCQQSQRTELAAEVPSLKCTHCGQEIRFPDGALVDGEVRHCLVCPSTDLFLRKDFPQRLGVTIVVLGFLASSIAWAQYWTYTTFGILFLVAGIDLVLYLLVGQSLMCYRCGAEYRGAKGLEKHSHFELETHEKHRQLQARLEQQASARRRGAGQPEPGR